ncbi:MAG: TolC family protein [Verrucomicrobia bacterium]|nr:TolC family protein [Verrucomicrobiota bacterium]
MVWLVVMAAGTTWVGCGRDHYRRSADKEVYGIVQKRQGELLGKTNNGFSVNTAYSAHKPKAITGAQIVSERAVASKQPMSLAEALGSAVAHSREYQFHKETVYLTALALTTERYNFRPKWSASSEMTFSKDSAGEVKRTVNSDVSGTQLLKTGGQLVLSVANDMLRYYSHEPRASHTTLFAMELVQPLLRGAGWDIVTENLTQAERNVIYEVRSFAHYERTFAVDIVTSYFRLLQQKDTVRNEYSNYKNLTMARERAEALGVDRLPIFQVDQARQDELRAKSRYVAAVQSYQSSLDDFKIKLGLPLSAELLLDDTALEELVKLGLPEVPLADPEGYKIAVERRLDLQNEMDRFEDSKRKIEVAANRLKPDLNIFASVSLPSRGETDYTKFEVGQYTASGGVELKLPLDRLKERNEYRTTLINFERQLRTFALALDNVRDEVRQGLRTLWQKRNDYAIQENAENLAKRRVESVTLLLQAGRAQMRDLLEAQSALVTAHNAVIAAMVDYHAARWTLLRDLGTIRTDVDAFWLAAQPVPQAGRAGAAAPAGPPKPQELISPEELFR